MLFLLDQVPCVGLSIGIERIFSILENRAKVCVCVCVCVLCVVCRFLSDIMKMFLQSKQRNDSNIHIIAELIHVNNESINSILANWF